MADVDVTNLKKLLNDAVDQWAAGVSPTETSPANEVTEVKNERVLPEGKRVVRTKTSGDRVYLLDEEKKTRQWLTNPEVLKAAGFEITDVVEVDEIEMQKYSMGPAVYRVADGHQA